MRDTATGTGDGLVQLAYLHKHKVSHSFHESMMRLVAYDAGNQCRLVATGGPFMISCDSGALVESRNLAFTRWLDETPHEWMLFVDTDMGFEPDAVDRLLQVADPVDRPVVGALCFGLREVAYDGLGGRRVLPVPTLFDWIEADGHLGFTPRWRYAPDAVTQVAGTGAAFLLVHRGVAEKLRAEHGDTWFDPTRYGDGRRVSEDLSFCFRLANAEVPVFVHTGVKTNHHKMVWITDRDYRPPALPLAAPEPEVAADAQP